MAKYPTKPMPPLFVGEWMDALGLQAQNVAADSGLSEGYISNLRKPPEGRPKNVSISKIYYLADAMGLTIDQLMKPPPRAAAIVELKKLPPDLLSRLHKIPPKPKKS